MLDRFNVVLCSSFARDRNRNFCCDAHRMCREDEDAIAEPCSVAHIVRHQQRCQGATVNQRNELVSQMGGEGFVQRCQRLIENEYVWINCKGACKCNAPGQPERKFVRIVSAMLSQLQNGEEGGESCFVDLLHHEPHIVFDRSPWKKPRFLKHHSDPGTERTIDVPAIVAIQAGNDPQHCCLAAARRTYECRDLTSAEREVDIAQDFQPPASGCHKELLIDFDLKQRAAASGMHVFQRVAPETFRSSSQRQRKPGHTQGYG